MVADSRVGRPSIEIGRPKSGQHFVAQPDQRGPVILTGDRDAEFVTTEPAHQRLRHQRAQRLDQMHQRPVSGAVPMRVIEHLEVVHVDLHVREGARLIDQLLAQLRKEVRAGESPGQRVAVGGIEQGLLGGRCGPQLALQRQVRPARQDQQPGNAQNQAEQWSKRRPAVPPRAR